MAEPLIFGLIGDPVGHSLSPLMHAAAFRALGLGAEYRLVRVPRGGDLAAAMRRLAETGGGNVTLPHKEAAAGLLDRKTEDVEATGACNCFWLDERGRLAGDNTDVGGIAAVLAAVPGLDLTTGKAVVLGAGGAAGAAVRALLVGGSRRVEIWNRTPARARRLARRLRTWVENERVSVLEPHERTRGRVTVVVQATSLGLAPGDPLPPPAASFGARHALDLVYAAGGTSWCREARRAGIPTRDGLDVLARQGALSLRRWLDVEPPLRAMQEALAAAVGGEPGTPE